MSSADLFVGWLPAIEPCDDESNDPVASTHRWWLPLRESSVAAMVGALVTPSMPEVVAALRRDPALCVFTAARLAQEHEQNWRPIPSRWSIQRLARWWCQHASTCWDSSRFFDAPTAMDAEQQFAKFVRLDHHFQTLPRARWLIESDLWFDAAGMVGKTSLKQLLHSIRLVDSPVEISDENETQSHAAHQTLCQLATHADEQSRLTRHFDRVLETQRRDLAKQLAYGLSHEINNPLANIATRAQGLIATACDDRQAESLQRIVDQSYRAHAMISDLMFYANPPLPNLTERFDAVGHVSRVIETVQARCHSDGIAIDFDSTSTDPCVGDAAMFGEALLCLLRNAIESIGVEGRIVVQILPASDVDASTNNQSILIRVSDSGQGLSAEDAARAFDPYFSGREAGRGLGLGLCRVERIVELHGGSIRLLPAVVGCVAELIWPTE